MIRLTRSVAAPMLIASFLMTACSGSGSSGSPSTAASNATATPSASPSQSSVPKPATFRSKHYGYTLTVPAGWTTRQALGKWNGKSGLDGTSALVDLIGQPSVSKGVFVAAAPWHRNLAAYKNFLIGLNAQYHGDTCPLRPDTRRHVTVGGQPGVLLAYNCGILVNNVGTVHHGVGYLLVFIDRGVATATDPTDSATFLTMLRSVKLPGG
jgi:hypothetical protein